jgi:formate dehydrogenase major subunit
MLKDLLSRWPVIQQIKTHSDGTGPEAWSDRTRNLKPKTAGCQVTRGVCPYCGVGCGQLVYHKDGKLVSIEGDPASPISRAISAQKARTRTGCTLIPAASLE